MIKKQKNKKILLRILPLVGMAAIVVAMLASGHTITVQDILQYSPKNIWLAGLFLVLLYALKSLSVVFPILPLYVAGGMIFSPLGGVVVNSLGVAVAVSLPYWIGRFSAGDTTAAIEQKYPKAANILALQKKNDLFFAFFTRILGFLPCDVVSMCMGGVGISYQKYLFGTMAGMLPGIITVSVAGAHISDPTSKEFILSVALTVILSVGSMLLYRVFLLKQANDKR